jgi:hypothetical protein
MPPAGHVGKENPGNRAAGTLIRAHDPAARGTSGNAGVGEFARATLRATTIQGGGTGGRTDPAPRPSLWTK